MRRRLEQFMQGRYGTDELTKFLMAICLILLLANIITFIYSPYYFTSTSYRRYYIICIISYEKANNIWFRFFQKLKHCIC